MNTKIKTWVGTVVIIIIAVTTGVFVWQYEKTQPEITPAQIVKINPKPVLKACPMIAKVCPDGTSVGPTGPNCKFVCPNETSAINTSDWQTYNYPKENISFQYPKELKVSIANKNSEAEFLEINSGGSDDAWPIVEIDYNLVKPSGNFRKWVIDNIPHDKVGDDITISGFPAVHLISDYSGQAYAMDQYFVFFNEKTYEASFIHSEKSQNLEDYDRFLQSIKLQ